MFNIGPMELLVLAIVGLVVLGPDRLPGFVRDSARLLRSLRDMATGAREQLRDELGPEFADLDLRDLDPRAIVKKHIMEAMNDAEEEEALARATPLPSDERPPYDLEAT